MMQSAPSRDGRKVIEFAAAVTAARMMGEVINAEAVTPEALMLKLTAIESGLSARIAAVEKKAGEVVNAAPAAEVAALTAKLTETQQAIVQLREVVNSKPSSDREIVLTALQKLYQGKSAAEVINAIPAGYLREEKVREVIAWSGAGFDLFNEAYLKPTTAISVNIGVAAVAGLRYTPTSSARAYTPTASSVTMKPIRDFVNAEGYAVQGTDFNVAADIARMFFDGRQISLAEQFLWGTKSGRTLSEEAIEPVKGVLTYTLTTSDEANKLRKIVVGAADSATAEQIRTGIKQAVARIPAPLRTAAKVRCCATSTTIALLADLKYGDGRSMVDPNTGVFDGCCTLVENSNMEDVGADKHVALVYVQGRSYGLAYNPSIEAGVETLQGEPQFWTRQNVAGAIADFATIYTIFVPT